GESDASEGHSDERECVPAARAAARATSAAAAGGAHASDHAPDQQGDRTDSFRRWLRDGVRRREPVRRGGGGGFVARHHEEGDRATQDGGSDFDDAAGESAEAVRGSHHQADRRLANTGSKPAVMPADVTRASLGDEKQGKTTPSLTAEAIARLVGGTVRGNGEARVRGVAPLDRATADDLSFLAQQRYAALFERSAAGVVLVAPELAELPGAASCRIVVREPHEAMLRVLPALYPEAPRERGVHATAVIGRGARLGDGVAIGPYAVIGDGAQLGDDVVVSSHVSVGAGVSVGAQSWLADGVTLYPGTVLGERVRVHAGARLGSDGFGYVPGEGGHRKIPHVGRCIIGDDVEIGANTTIDRGSVDDTVVGAGTKIDNLVHIAHNVRIGRLCLIMAQVGI